MRAYKLDYTTIVLDEARYGNLPGVEYYEIEVDGQRIKFAQHDRAVLPALLEQLVSLSHSPSLSSDASSVILSMQLFMDSNVSSYSRCLRRGNEGHLRSRCFT